MGKFNRRNRPGDRRDFNGGGRRPDRSNMYQAVCGECGKDCEVPFKPTGDRPVLCENCFSKKRGNRPEKSGGRDFGREKTMYTAICDNCGEKCEVPFRPTIGKPVYCSTCFDQMGGSDRTKNSNSARNNDQLSGQIANLNLKLDKILDIITKEPAKTAPKAKTTAKSKKKPAVKKVKPTKKKK